MNWWTRKARLCPLPGGNFGRQVLSLPLLPDALPHACFWVDTGCDGICAVHRGRLVPLAGAMTGPRLALEYRLRSPGLTLRAEMMRRLVPE
jgi:hypothetical protein